MATFVAKNSGGVKKKPMIILRVYFFSLSFNKRGQRLAGVRARIHTEIREQPSFFIKL